MKVPELRPIPALTINALRRAGLTAVFVVFPLSASVFSRPVNRAVSVPQAADQQAAKTAREEAKSLMRHDTRESDLKAIEKFEIALALFRKSGDKRGEADALFHIGLIHDGFSEAKKAREYYLQALELMRALGDREGEIETLKGLGTAHSRLGERKTAFDFYNQALAACRETKNEHAEADIAHELGILHANMGNRAEALEYFTRASALARSLPEKDDELEAKILNSLGLEFYRRGELQKATESLDRSLALFTAAGKESRTASPLNNLGMVHARLGNRQKALEFYNRALDLRRRQGDRQAEANLLNNIAVQYWNLNDKGKALEYLEQALPIAREIGDKVMEAKTLINIGLAHKILKNHSKALEAAQRALPLIQAAGDKEWEGNALAILAGVAENAGDIPKAAQYHRQSLDLRRSAGDKESESKALQSLALFERRRGNLDEARVRIEEALQILEFMRSNIGINDRASFLVEFREYYEFYIDLLMDLHRKDPKVGLDAAAFEQSERARARTLLELLVESKVDIRQGIDPQLLEREQTLQRQIRERQGALTALLLGKHTQAEAETAKKEFEDLIEKHNALEEQIRRASPRYSALTQPRPLGLRDIQRELDDETVILEYALGEKRSYLWAVTNRTISVYVLPGQKEIETTARQVIDALTMRVKPMPDKTREERDRLVAQADADFAGTSTKLSEMILAPALSNPQPSTLRSRLHSKRRFVIVPDGLLHYLPFAALPVPTKLESERKKPGNCNETQPPSHKPQNLDSSNPPLLIERGEVVVVPSASILATLRRETAGRTKAPGTVAVFADPVFGGPEDNRLQTVKRKDVSVENAPSPDGESNDPGKLASRFSEVLGRNVSFVKDAPQGQETRTQSVIPRLPGTRLEAKRIAEMTNPATSLVRLDFDATRAGATNPELGKYRCVHFATHGWLDAEHPELSALILSLYDKVGNPQDGFLRVADIYNLDLPVELVVLSACQTGIGKEIKGEGVVNLTRGFMYAGAPRVVVSLWNVNDAATAELMKRFYRGLLKENLRPAAALRQAQTEMRRLTKWTAPYYWAAFELQGEWK